MYEGFSTGPIRILLHYDNANRYKEVTPSLARDSR